MTAILTDPHLRQCIADIVKQAKIFSIIETGTNSGDSTGVFAEMVPMVWSVELDENLHFDGLNRFRQTDNIILAHGDSASFLSDFGLAIMKDAEENAGSVLFVLDAHWGPDWPLARELGQINRLRANGHKCVVFIDDWISDQMQFTGCYGGLRSDDSKGHEKELQPCSYVTFAEKLDAFPHFYEPVYPEGGIGYAIFSDFPLILGDSFRTNR